MVGRFLLHLGRQTQRVGQGLCVYTHLILFAVIFCETGLVVTPFLPGDSLLFAAGAFAADRSLRLEWLMPLLIVAAILGDTVNYAIGYWIGARALGGKIPFVKKSSIDRTHAFFEKHGPKTIILARFVPIVRTFAHLSRALIDELSPIRDLQRRRRHILGHTPLDGRLLVRRLRNRPKELRACRARDRLLSIVPMFIEWWAHRANAKKVAEAATPPQ